MPKTCPLMNSSKEIKIFAEAVKPVEAEVEDLIEAVDRIEVADLAEVKAASSPEETDLSDKSEEVASEEITKTVTIR
jgi:hypothetical protein